MCNESRSLQVIKKCFCAMLDFLLGSIHISMDVKCDGNYRITNGIYQFPLFGNHDFC
jgi:hypothetical protein